MGILVECPKCKVRGSVKRKVCKCGNQVQKSDSKNYWIDYYINGKRTRERICRIFLSFIYNRNLDYSSAAIKIVY